MGGGFHPREFPYYYNFDLWYHISRGCMLFCVLAMIYPILQMFRYVCCKPGEDTPDTISEKEPMASLSDNWTPTTRSRLKTIKEKPKHYQSKIILTLSILFFMSFILLTSYDTLAKYVNLHMTELWCRVMFSISGWLYVIAKALLYNYFILRANDTFWNTSYEYNQCIMQSILPLEILFIVILWTPITYLSAVKVNYSIMNTPYGGQICRLHLGSNDFLEGVIIFGFGCFVDGLFSSMAVGMLSYKLIKIIQNASMDEIYTLFGNKKSNYKKPSIVGIDANSINSINMTNEEEEKEFGIETTKDSSAINPYQVIDFHSQTTKHNKIYLLITKLLTILMIEIVSMCLAFLFSTFTKMVWCGYVIDSLIDIYCLFLTFKFSEKIYYKFCCGINCTRLCFPLIKMIAISIRCHCCQCCLCCDKYYEYNNHIIDRHIFKRKCCIICWPFCCSRCYKMKRKKQKQIYRMAKSEISLLLATKLDYKQNERTDDSHVWNTK